MQISLFLSNPAGLLPKGLQEEGGGGFWGAWGAWVGQFGIFTSILVEQNYIISSVMKRNSIRKASTFKLQAARAKFNNYLSDLENCAVVRKWPSHLEEIRASSEALFDMCYSFKENSPFTLALNYDNKSYGFHSNDNIMTFRDYLGDAQQAYLYGDFNAFHPDTHPLLPDKDMGPGWFALDFDLNKYRLEEGSRIMVRLVDREGREFRLPPPSCYFVEEGVGVYRREGSRALSVKHRIGHLLSYTIDLAEMGLRECLAFVEGEMEVLQCYNTVILKNLFDGRGGLLQKFSLSSAKAQMLEEIVEKLSLANIKVVLEWNFDAGDLPELPNPLEREYFRPTERGDYQFDLSREPVLAYYLASIAHYLKFYGVAGIHLTKVHKISRNSNGTLALKLINLLCERLKEDSITLASSKEFIAGLTEPILEGGLGFGFTYNFHETLSLKQQHSSIFEMVKQIQSSSNCLSLLFNQVGRSEYIYLLFTFLISKRGIFTRGPFAPLKDDLKKVLKLRKQEELFHSESTMERIDQDCMVVSRGAHLLVFNFSPRTIDLDLPGLQEKGVIFVENEGEVKVREGGLTIGPLNCIMYEQ